MPEKKEYEFRVGAMGESLWTSEKFPMVRFFKKGPASKDDCFFCDNQAVLVADLGTQERRCCSNPECMAKAAEQVWEFICYEAKEEGFHCDEEGIRAFLVAKNDDMREFLKRAAQRL
ncbi:MAG: hypothetical protein NTX82_03965 [Candidatus Parcubacteria bacterium]|nr:hypothetical protein [Candidatus Parcubacteria bacterium]